MPLIARAGELAALTTALQRPPAVVVVEGETGVGKTTVIDAALRAPALSAVTSLVGHCRPFREPLPLAPIVEALAGTAERLPPEALNPVTGALRPLLPELADVLPPPPDPLLGSRAEHQRVLRAGVSLLAAVRPVILVVEDIHWMDAATEDFLRHLGTAVPEGVCVALTFRPEDFDIERIDWFARPAPDVTALHMDLRPFDAAGIADLARAILGVETVSSELVRFLQQRTGGLPFAVEQVLRLMQDHGPVVREDGRWLGPAMEELQVPPAVRDTVIVRLRRLSPTARHVAEAAAVLAAPATASILAEIADHDEPETIDALGELHEAWVLHEPRSGTSEFRHALARQAVEESIPPPRLTWLHRRAAQALEATETPPMAELARHYRAAGEIAEWIRCAEAAAAVASAAGNHAVAVELLEDVLTIAALDADARFRLGVAYGKAAVQARAHRRAAAVLWDVLPDLPLSEGRRGRMRFLRACSLAQAGAIEEASEQVQIAIGELDGFPVQAGSAMTYMAYPWLANLRLDEHLAWLRRALDCAHGSRDERLIAIVEADEAAILVQVGSPEGWPLVERRLEDPRLPSHERVRLAYNAAYGALITGHLRRAHRLLDLADGIRVPTPRFLAPLAGLRTWWTWATGRWAGLEAQTSELLESGADSPTASALAALIGGSLRVARGDLTEGLEQLTHVADKAVASGELVPHLLACGELTRVALARGDVETGLASATRVLSLLEVKETWAWAGEVTPWVAQALADSGRLEQSATLVASLGSRLEDTDAAAAAAGLVQAHAVVAAAQGRMSDAATAYADALEAWQHLPRPHLALLCMAERGRVLADIDRDAGAAVLREAYAGLDQLGARWDAARVGKTLRRLGLRVGHRGGRRGYGSALSPREQEVARLAGAGYSNRQIAERLVLSPRTVERHISSVLAKLDLTSRHDISPSDVS